MGNKVPKPVVTPEEVEKDLAPEDIARYQRFFLAATGGRDVGLKKEAFVSKTCKKLKFVGEKGLQRLFEVCDHTTSQTLTWREFMVAMYLFDKGSEDQKLRLLFNMFDLNADGSVSKKDLQTMGMSFIVGDSPGGFSVPKLGKKGEIKENETEEATMAVFKPLAELMAETGIDAFDYNRDNKLSFDEWKGLAMHDARILRVLHTMPTVVPTQGHTLQIETIELGSGVIEAVYSAAVPLPLSQRLPKTCGDTQQNWPFSCHSDLALSSHKTPLELDSQGTNQ